MDLVPGVWALLVPVWPQVPRRGNQLCKCAVLVGATSGAARAGRTAAYQHGWRSGIAAADHECCWFVLVSGPSRIPVLPRIGALLDCIWTTAILLLAWSVSGNASAAHACYPASALLGLPPKRPFARELAALRSLVRLPTSAAAVTRLILERARPRGGADTLATRTSARGCSCGWPEDTRSTSSRWRWRSWPASVLARRRASGLARWRDVRFEKPSADPFDAPACIGRLFVL
jgi:hypothetical protein